MLGLWEQNVAPVFLQIMLVLILFSECMEIFKFDQFKPVEQVLSSGELHGRHLCNFLKRLFEIKRGGRKPTK